MKCYISLDIKVISRDNISLFALVCQARVNPLVNSWVYGRSTTSCIQTDIVKKLILYNTNINSCHLIGWYRVT